MADDYVRETLRTLRERTGDAYVPLSEVLDYLREQASRDRDARNVAIDHAWDEQAGRYAERALALDAAASEIARRWGPACGVACDCCESEPAMDCEAARG